MSVWLDSIWCHKPVVSTLLRYLSPEAYSNLWRVYKPCRGIKSPMEFLKEHILRNLQTFFNGNEKYITAIFEMIHTCHACLSGEFLIYTWKGYDTGTVKNGIIELIIDIVHTSDMPHIKTISQAPGVSVVLIDRPILRLLATTLRHRRVWRSINVALCYQNGQLQGKGQQSLLTKRCIAHPVRNWLEDDEEIGRSQHLQEALMERMQKRGFNFQTV